jgi:hypothetical protein
MTLSPYGCKRNSSLAVAPSCAAHPTSARALSHHNIHGDDYARIIYDDH